MRGPGRTSDLLVHRRQGIWQIQLAATPGHMAVTSVLEIPVQTHGQGHTVIAADNHLSLVRLNLKDILTLVLRDDLKFKGICVLSGRKQPLQQASCSRHRRIFGTTQIGCTSDNQETERVKILWDGSLLLKEPREFLVQAGEYPKPWREFINLVQDDISFCELPDAVQTTITKTCNVNPSQIINIQMADKASKGWEMAALYIGLGELSKISSKPYYFESLEAIGKANRWKIGDRIYHADDHCVGQMYLDMYTRFEDIEMLASVTTLEREQATIVGMSDSPKNDFIIFHVLIVPSVRVRACWWFLNWGLETPYETKLMRGLPPQPL